MLNIFSKRQFQTEPGDFGLRLVIDSAWSPAYADYMKAHGIAEITVNYARGFQGDNIDFLRTIPFLRGLLFISYAVEDGSPINDLHELRSLTVGYIGKTAIDFGHLPNLEACYMVRGIKYVGLHTLKKITNLSFSNYQEKTIVPLLGLTTLERLGLSTSQITSLAGISQLTNLSALMLANLTKLTSLHGIDGLKNLETLEISGCRKIGSIRELENLRRLKRLELIRCGEIESLKPLTGLPMLEKFYFYEDTNIMDGDISVLETLPMLNHTAFKNRKHYTHICDETQKIIKKT